MDPAGFDYTFEASVGLLPYPMTFLVTDLISEVYGRKRADDVVKAELAASLLTLAVITLAGAAPATAWSPVTDGEFDHVFGQTALAMGGTGRLPARPVPRRPHLPLLEMRTGGRMLWLRNNFSTIPSQFVDTMVVLLLLCSVGEVSGACSGPCWSMDSASRCSWPPSTPRSSTSEPDGSAASSDLSPVGKSPSDGRHPSHALAFRTAPKGQCGIIFPPAKQRAREAPAFPLRPAPLLRASVPSVAQMHIP